MDSKNLTSTVPAPPAATIVSPKAPNYHHSWLPLPPSDSEIASSLALEPLQELLHPPPWELLAGATARKRQTRGEIGVKCCRYITSGTEIERCNRKQSWKNGEKLSTKGDQLSQNSWATSLAQKNISCSWSMVYSNGKTTLYEQVPAEFMAERTATAGCSLFLLSFSCAIDPALMCCSCAAVLHTRY